MKQDFEVQISPEFLAKMESDLKIKVDALASENAFTNYNRGGGPAGNYDRHYDKSTRVSKTA
jgi:hypothetical protein